MKYLITILVFFLSILIIYQIACGFPLISKILEKKRKKRWIDIQKTKKENEQKIKLLDSGLKGKNEIETYISLNKFNLPEDDEWKPLLPKMIEELLDIGWTTEMPLSTKYKFGSYEIEIYNCSQEIKNKSRSIINKYLDYSIGI